MSRPAICPHCGEELDVPHELRGKTVRCASCANTFTTPAEAPPPPRATRAADRPADESRSPWDEPRRVRKRSGSLMWLWLMLGGGTLFLCAGCCGLGFLAIQLDRPDFQSHTSEKGRFVADFPGKPIEARRTGDDGFDRECTEFSREFPDETYFVHYRDLPTEPKTDVERDKVFQDACTRALQLHANTREQSRKPTTVSGHSGIDLFLTHDDATTTHVRFVVVGKRIYAVGITGQMLQPQSQRLKKFLDSFRITTQAKPKQAEAEPKAEAEPDAEEQSKPKPAREPAPPPRRIPPR